MPKKQYGNSRSSKSKRAGKKRASVLHKKRLTAASSAQAEKGAQLSSQAAEETAVKEVEQSSSERVEHSSKRASDEAYRTLHEACAKSKHLAGQLSQQRSGLLLNLPASLPSSLIFRALNKEMNHYKELRIHRIAARENQLAQLELFVEGMRENQLTTFIEELDELIGDFTGRS